MKGLDPVAVFLREAAVRLFRTLHQAHQLFDCWIEVPLAAQQVLDELLLGRQSRTVFVEGIPSYNAQLQTVYPSLRRVDQLISDFRFEDVLELALNDDLKSSIVLLFEVGVVEIRQQASHIFLDLPMLHRHVVVHLDDVEIRLGGIHQISLEMQPARFLYELSELELQVRNPIRRFIGALQARKVLLSGCPHRRNYNTTLCT